MNRKKHEVLPNPEVVKEAGTVMNLELLNLNLLDAHS